MACRFSRARGPRTRHSYGSHQPCRFNPDNVVFSSFPASCTGHFWFAHHSSARLSCQTLLDGKQNKQLSSTNIAVPYKVERFRRKVIFFAERFRVHANHGSTFQQESTMPKVVIARFCLHHFRGDGNSKCVVRSEEGRTLREKSGAHRKSFERVVS